MAIKFLSGLNLSNVTAGSILKLDSNGNIVAAVDGTDYNTGSADSWSATGSDIYRNSDVRIGTYQSGVAPSARLHVFDYQTTDPKLLIEDGNTGDASMQFKISTQQYTMGIDNSDSDKFIIANAAGFNLAANTHALEISTNGKITVPAHSSNGSIRLELGGYNRLRFNGGIDLLGYGSDHLWVIGNSTTNTINLGADWDWDKQVAISYTPNTVGAYGGVLSIGQTEKNNANWTHGVTRFYTSGGEKMRIDSAGNLGVGTTSPEEKLHVIGNIKQNDYIIGRGAEHKATTMPDYYKIAQVTIDGTYGTSHRIEGAVSYGGDNEKSTKINFWISFRSGGNLNVGAPLVRYGYKVENLNVASSNGFESGSVDTAFRISKTSDTSGGNKVYEIQFSPNDANYISAQWELKYSDYGNQGSYPTTVYSTLQTVGTDISDSNISKSQDSTRVDNNTWITQLGVGSSNNTSFDFYNNGISYFNGNVTVDANLSMTGGGYITTDSNNALVLRSDVQHGQGDEDAVISFKQSTTEHAKIDQDGYMYATGFKTTTASTGLLKADGTVDTTTLGTMASESASDYKDSDAVETYVALELASYTLTSALGTAATSAATDFVAVTGDTMTGNLEIKRGHGDLTFLTLKQEDTSGDLVAQKSFIDFTFVDSNTNETPQVRIGAEVGNNDGSASNLAEEGMGAFVVYTNNADTDAGAAGTSLAERFRVDRQGYVGIGTTSPDYPLEVESPEIYIAHFKTTANVNQVFGLEAPSGRNTNLYFYEGSQAKAGIRWDGSNDKFIFKVGNTATDALTITDAANATFAGDVTIVDNLKATGQNMKFHVNGTHVFNVDVNKNIYPQTHNSTDLGFSSTLAFRQLYLSGDITSSAGATFGGDISLGDNQLVFSNTNVAAPSTTDTGAGTRILLYSPGGEGNHYAIGIESNNMWFNSDVGYKWYRDSSAVMTLDSSSNLDVTGAVTTGGKLTIGTVDATSTATTALFLGAANEVKKRSLGSNAFNSTSYLPLAGGTITGQVIFPSAATTKPVLPNGYIARNDNSDTDGTHDIWGISERYYPSNATDADAWGIQWSGTPNEINFIGAGQKKLSIDLDTAGTVKIDGNAVATESYVGTAISNLVDSSPAALDTLNELAAALGDDASFSTTMSTALGNRLRIDVNNQSLSSTELANARTNLGLGTAATSAATDFVAVSGDTMTGSLTVEGDLTVGKDGTTPQVKLIYDDNHTNGDRWDTIIDIGKTEDRHSGDGQYPTYVTHNGYSISFQSNSDGVLFGMEERVAGNYRPVIAWGDDNSDTPFNFRFNNSVVMSLGYNGVLTSTGNMVAGGNLKTTLNLDMRGQDVENATNVIYFNANNGNGSNTSNDVGTGITWKPLYSGYTKRSAGIMQIGEGNYFKSGLAFYTNNSSDNSTDWSERMRISKEGNVGIGVAEPTLKLEVAGAVHAGGKRSYTKIYGSLDTTGQDVAGLVSGGNGNSASFTFTCHGHTGGYQKIVYSCYNTSATTWNVKKVIDEGTNDFDVTVSASGATRTFTFVSRSGTKSYSPMVHVEHVGHGFDSSHI